MNPTVCPICETDSADQEVYPSTVRWEELTPEVFSARRVPDRIHYRMVRCGTCGLLRSNPILSPDELARLYGRSHFTYAAEAVFTRRTYGRYLRRATKWVKDRSALLEIGCGSGFFLEEALAQGFARVAGVEPSAEAAAHAAQSVRQQIQPGLYDTNSYPKSSFDCVCAFQVFDHVPDATAMLRAAHEQLREQGVLLIINHDVGGLFNRMLGEASPIVDVEHTVLFDKSTIRRMVEKCGFSVREVFSVRNTYPLHYWARLAPSPKAIKPGMVRFLEHSALGRLPITLGAGNLGVIATKG